MITLYLKCFRARVNATEIFFFTNFNSNLVNIVRECSPVASNVQNILRQKTPGTQHNKSDGPLAGPSHVKPTGTTTNAGLLLCSTNNGGEHPSLLSPFCGRSVAVLWPLPGRSLLEPSLTKCPKHMKIDVFGSRPPPSHACQRAAVTKSLNTNCVYSIFVTHTAAHNDNHSSFHTFGYIFPKPVLVNKHCF